MKLTKKQKAFLKTIESKKTRYNQKQQFKLQNEFDSQIVSWIKVETNDQNYCWHKHDIGESFEKMKNSLTTEKLNELTNPNVVKELSWYVVSEDNVTYYWFVEKIDYDNLRIIGKGFDSNNREVESGSTLYGNSTNFNWFLENAKLADLNIIFNRTKEKENLSKSNNSEVPKEFYVEITKENKEVLQKIWAGFHNNLVGFLAVGGFLHSNSLFTHCYESNSASDDDGKINKISIEEFMRYIGEGNLAKIGVLPKISDKLFDLGFRLEKTPNSKTLDFDLPKNVNEIEVVSPIELSQKVNAQERNEKLYDYIEREFNVFCTNDNLQEIEDIVKDMLSKD